jgi:hypothetical protein
MITREQVLKVTTETEIIRHYVPDFSPEKKKNYTSPFGGADKSPSLSFYETKGKLMFKSHNTGHQGDVFQFVADIESIDCKKEFSKVLEAINTNLKLGLNGQPKAEAFKIEYQSFSPIFLAYFNQFGIDQATLLKFKVRQVKSLAFTNAANKRRLITSN